MYKLNKNALFPLKIKFLSSFFLCAFVVYFLIPYVLILNLFDVQHKPAVCHNFVDSSAEEGKGNDCVERI